jgi:peroxiredoxin-like protein
MSTPHHYTVNLSWKHGRQGLLSSEELEHDIPVATPPPFPKGVKGIWSPEHLFTSAVSSCLMTTFLAIAENSKLEFEDFACKATGKLEQLDGRYMMSEVVLDVHLTLVNQADYSKAERVLQKSEAACLITNSITSKVTLNPTIKVVNLAHNESEPI